MRTHHTTTLHLRCLLYLLLLLPAFEGQAQGRPSRKERIAERRHERRASRTDPQRWERMPQWSAGFGYSAGYTAEQSLNSQLNEVGTDRHGAFRGEVSRRLRKGWYVLGSLEQNRVRTAGMKDAMVLRTWSDGFWFGTTYTEYQSDMVTVQHDVTTLSLMTGIFNAPFPRRKAVGITLSVAGGLGVHMVQGDHGIARRQVFTVSHAWLDGIFGSDDEAVDVNTQWAKRNACDTQVAMGLSMMMDMRVELWLGRNVSLLVPSLAITIPLARPHFDAVNDAEGEVLKAYDLDLVSARFGTGLVVHF